ncbi:unnamed protein product [Lymnaea stagnalis]|uniref:Uncharacterized protein n=1 Tax=Lymnaea stagnalis TaxID=6523 RepID=A0AAV2GZ11_LYMST
MMDPGEADVHFVERSESVINRPQPRQLTLTRTTGGVQSGFSVVTTYFQSSSSSSGLDIESSTVVTSDIQNGSELNRSISGEYQRSEVNVEVDGIRETTLSTSDNVISSRVKTVYGRSSSGSTSSLDLEHKELLDGIQIGSDSAFGVDGEVEGLSGSEPRQRKISDSYYIKQTYQIGSAESSSLSVTAIQNVTFKSSKDVEIGAHSKGGPVEGIGAHSKGGPGEGIGAHIKGGPGEGAHYVERVEEIIPGDQPNTLGSPEDKTHVQFAWYDTNHKDADSAEKLKSARENVQQLIENSYMVSDISSVIDNDCMGPDAQRLDTESESSVDVLSTSDSKALQTTSQMSKISTVQSSSTIDATVSLSTYPSRPVDLSVFSSNRISPDRESPPRLTYSPGIAIRSYALEELAEKKSRRTPDILEAVAKSSRFDEESSQVDIDDGSSVDELPSGQTIPHLKKTDVSLIQSGKHSENSVRTSSTQDVGIFKLTKVQKVTLSDEHLLVNASDQSQARDAPDGQHNYVQETNKEEEDEMLDKLVDLESIQVGYRFHDVGMMQDVGGICNMAFDDSDESEVSLQTYSTDQSTFSLPSHGTASIYVSGSPRNTYSASEAASHILSPESGQTWQTVGNATQSNEQSSLYLQGSTVISSIQGGHGTTGLNSDLLQSQSELDGLPSDVHKQHSIQTTSGSQESSLRVSGTREAVVSATGATNQLSDEGPQSQMVQLEQTNTDQQYSLEPQSNSSVDQSVQQTSGSSEAVLNALGSSEAATLSTAPPQSETNKLEDKKSVNLAPIKNKADGKVKADVEIQSKEKEGVKEIHAKDISQAVIPVEDEDSQLSVNEFKLRQTHDSNTGTIQVKAQNINSQSSTLATETVTVTKTLEPTHQPGDKTEVPAKSSKSKSKKSKQKSRAHLDKENEAVAKVVKEASHPVQVSELSLNQVSSTAENVSVTIRATEAKGVSGKQDSVELTNKGTGNSSQIVENETKAGHDHTTDKSGGKSGSDNHAADNHSAAPGSKAKGKGKNRKNKGKTDIQTQNKEAVNVAHVKKEEDAPAKTKSKHSKHKKHLDKPGISEAAGQIAAESDQKVQEVQSTEQVTVSNILGTAGTADVQQAASLTGNVSTGDSVSSTVTEEQQGRVFVETEQRDRFSQVSSSEWVTIGKKLGSTGTTDIGQGASKQMSVSSEQQGKVLMETEQRDSVSQGLSSVTISSKLGSTASTDMEQGASIQISVSSEQQAKVLKETDQRDRVSQGSSSVTISSKLGSTAKSDMEQGAAIQMSVTSEQQAKVLKETEQMDRVSQGSSSVTISSKLGTTASTDMEQGASIQMSVSSEQQGKVLMETDQRDKFSQSSDVVTISNKYGSNVAADVHKGTLLQSPENYGKGIVESERSETTGRFSSAEHVATGDARLFTTTTVSGQAAVLQTLEGQGQLMTQDPKTSIPQTKVVSQTKSISVTRTTPPRPHIQVSRRFNVHNKFETVLKSMGAILNSDTLTLDVYYDTSDFDLTLSDCWLRTHNGKWQLHANFSKLLNTKTEDEYFESEEASVILATLKLIIRSGQPCESGSTSIASFVQKSGLKEFVRYRTVRKTYSLTDVTVDLEMPEYGFWVGNVTASILGRSNDAVNTIYTFWKKTGEFFIYNSKY